MEESGTLSDTLLPYINKVTDFSFLEDDMHFTAGRFLDSLTTHFSDMEESVSCGFVLFALKINPRALKGLITTEQSKKALK
jgi:hypothetical protein